MKRAAGLFAATILLALPAHAISSDAATSTKTLSAGPVTMTFALVPKGTFTMGSPNNEKDRSLDEIAHEVTISHDCWVESVPVTYAQFDAYVKATGAKTEAQKGTSGGFGMEDGALVQNAKYTWRTPGYTVAPDYPVTLVTYDDAKAFATWASAQAHVTLRLPTEAEYERAERGETTSAYYTKDGDPLALGWFGPNSAGHPHSVSTRAPNAYGLYDTSGNVWEWCEDVYGQYSSSAITDPIGATPPAGEPLRRVLRGGSFLKDPKNGRSAARYRNTPGSRNADNGFRLVFDPSAPTTIAPIAPTGVPVAPTSPNLDQGLVNPPPRSGGSSGLLAVPLGLGCFGGFLALLVWLITRVVSGSRPMGRPNVTTRTTSDGFFLVTDAPYGSRVRYECVVRGVSVTDVVPVSGRETFVYTGGEPSVIRILEVVSLSSSSYRGTPAPIRSFGGARQARAPRSEPRPFAGTPRAY